MAHLRVAARIPSTRAEGPGLRYALWLQGCSIRCPSCCNPHFFEAAGGAVFEVADLVEAIGAQPGIEGITVLGGEPFDQPDGLAALAEGVRGRRLSVMVFTGFTLEELEARPEPAVRTALAATDVLVDGRYQATEPETERLWVGSRNQRFHYRTARYGPAMERPAPGGAAETVEVRVRADGIVEANGWPIWPAR